MHFFARLVFHQMVEIVNFPDVLRHVSLEFRAFLIELVYEADSGFHDLWEQGWHVFFDFLDDLIFRLFCVIHVFGLIADIDIVVFLHFEQCFVFFLVLDVIGAQILHP